jgi:hypothetical protein
MHENQSSTQYGKSKFKGTWSQDKVVLGLTKNLYWFLDFKDVSLMSSPSKGHDFLIKPYKINIFGTFFLLKILDE